MNKSLEVSSYVTAKEKVEILLRSPELFGRKLGGRGFSLPDVSEFSMNKILGPTGAINWVYCHASLDWRRKVRYEFTHDAEDNILILSHSCNVHGRVRCCGSRNLAILLGDENYYSPLDIMFNNSESVFFWGAGCTSNTSSFSLSCDSSKIFVGEECMFSSDTNIRTHDDHGIIDLTNGQTINFAADVVVEPYVWVGEGVRVLKGVCVGQGSILAIRSVVTKDVPAHSIVAGVPAKVIKANVGWVRERIPHHDALSRLTKAFEGFMD